MATASATVSKTVITCGSVRGNASGKRESTKLSLMGGLNSFGGLKAQNQISCMGVPVCTQESFYNMVKSYTRTKVKRGGALSAKCNAADEIFRIAAIINGLVLVGVAVGFVLLRVEASIEEE